MTSSDPGHDFSRDADRSNLMPADVVADSLAAPLITSTGDEIARASTEGRSLWADVWRELRSNWVFWFGLVIVAVMMLVAIFPQLFAWGDPTPNSCDLEFSAVGPSRAHPFGYDIFGCGYYTQVVYGARPSITVGITVALLSAVVGGFLGAAAGYYGGALDSLIARVTDIFFAIPFVLGAIVILSTITTRTVWSVSFAIAVLSWTTVTRLMRGSVLSIRNQDYVMAAKAVGSSTSRIITRHVLPNSIAPVIVYSTITIGAVISLEATLTFLGIGLQPPSISWGLQIQQAQNRVLNTPHLLIFPGMFLSITVLGFLLLGDAVRDALDPKLR